MRVCVQVREHPDGYGLETSMLFRCAERPAVRACAAVVLVWRERGVNHEREVWMTTWQ